MGVDPAAVSKVKDAQTFRAKAYTSDLVEVQSTRSKKGNNVRFLDIQMHRQAAREALAEEEAKMRRMKDLRMCDPHFRIWFQDLPNNKKGYFERFREKKTWTRDDFSWNIYLLNAPDCPDHVKKKLVVAARNCFPRSIENPRTVAPSVSPALVKSSEHLKKDTQSDKNGPLYQDGCSPLPLSTTAPTGRRKGNKVSGSPLIELTVSKSLSSSPASPRPSSTCLKLNLHEKLKDPFKNIFVSRGTSPLSSIGREIVPYSETGHQDKHREANHPLPACRGPCLAHESYAVNSHPPVKSGTTHIDKELAIRENRALPASSQAVGYSNLRDAGPPTSRSKLESPTLPPRPRHIIAPNSPTIPRGRRMARANPHLADHLPWHAPGDASRHTDKTEALPNMETSPSFGEHIGAGQSRQSIKTGPERVRGGLQQLRGSGNVLKLRLQERRSPKVCVPASETSSFPAPREYKMVTEHGTWHLICDPSSRGANESCFTPTPGGSARAAMPSFVSVQDSLKPQQHCPPSKLSSPRRSRPNSPSTQPLTNTGRRGQSTTPELSQSTWTSSARRTQSSLRNRLRRSSPKRGSASSSPAPSPRGLGSTSDRGASTSPRMSSTGSPRTQERPSKISQRSISKQSVRRSSLTLRETHSSGKMCSESTSPVESPRDSLSEIRGSPRSGGSTPRAIRTRKRRPLYPGHPLQHSNSSSAAPSPRMRLASRGHSSPCNRSNCSSAPRSPRSSLRAASARTSLAVRRVTFRHKLLRSIKRAIISTLQFSFR